MITRATLSTIEQGLPKYRSMLAGNDAYVPPAFESIATATGTGSSSTITFSSIPSTYQHLQIRAIMRSTEASANTNVYLRTNNDSGTNYVHHRILGDGSSVAAFANTSQTQIFIGGAPAASTASNILSVAIIDVHDYASTSKYKTVRVFFGRNSNNQYTENIILSSGLWMSTSAIDSLQFNLSNPNFSTQTSIALYGIKGA